MLLSYYDYQKREFVKLDTNKADFNEFKNFIPRYESFNRRGKSYLIEGIELAENLSIREKIELEKKVAGRNSYFHLRQGLYNVLKMVQSDKRGFLTKDKIASIKSLKSSCLIYNKPVEIEIDNEYVKTTKTIYVNVLTKLGENVLDKMVKQATELANQEMSRLKSLGF